MANTNLSLSVVNGVDGFRLSDITVGVLAPNAGDIELRINAVDANGHTVRRKNVLIALCAFQRALESGGTFTTDLAE